MQIGQAIDGTGPMFASLGRNRRCATLDLRRPEGQDLLRRLAARCDVVVENFRPGTLAAWNLDWARLSAANPRLVTIGRDPNPAMEKFVPSDHPLRSDKTLVDDCLRSLDGLFNEIYTGTGRASISPEKLLRALLLQVFCNRPVLAVLTPPC